jgi:hypothetical protein
MSSNSINIKLPKRIKKVLYTIDYHLMRYSHFFFAILGITNLVLIEQLLTQVNSNGGAIEIIAITFSVMIIYWLVRLDVYHIPNELKRIKERIKTLDGE